jgi:hypothetical protein
LRYLFTIVSRPEFLEFHAIAPLPALFGEKTKEMKKMIEDAITITAPVGRSKR